MSRSASLQPQVLRVTDPRSGTAGSWKAPHASFCMHCDHEPIRFGPRAVPARSGRAKTIAWVIFLGCWRGPYAATGDRSRSATSPRPTDGQRLVHGKPPRFFNAHRRPLSQAATDRDAPDFRHFRRGNPR